MTSDAVVRRADVLNAIHTSLAAIRTQQDGYTDDYIQGYEEALEGLADRLTGWCAERLEIPSTKEQHDA